MSFSAEIKEELSKISNLANKEIIKYEFIGYLISNNTKKDDKGFIKFSTESEYNINRFAKLLKNFNIEKYEIKYNGKDYVISLKKQLIENYIQINDKQIIFNKELNNIDAEKSLLRGVFLGSGYINEPNNKYHFELNVSNEKNGRYLKEILLKNEINVKSMIKKNSYMIYLKEGEEISKFFAFIGSNRGVLRFEEARVNKEMNNKINRLVNCKTANLNKTINASIEQIEAIRKLQNNKKFYKLDDNLKELAKLRLENPNCSLIELGQMLSEPLGKSGVNYRLKKIVEISKEE